MARPKMNIHKRKARLDLSIDPRVKALALRTSKASGIGISPAVEEFLSTWNPEKKEAKL